jgi:hypothetical protein
MLEMKENIFLNGKEFKKQRRELILNSPIPTQQLNNSPSQQLVNSPTQQLSFYFSSIFLISGLKYSLLFNTLPSSR